MAHLEGAAKGMGQPPTREAGRRPCPQQQPRPRMRSSRTAACRQAAQKGRAHLPRGPPARPPPHPRSPRSWRGRRPAGRRPPGRCLRMERGRGGHALRTARVGNRAKQIEANAKANDKATKAAPTWRGLEPLEAGLVGRDDGIKQVQRNVRGRQVALHLRAQSVQWCSGRGGHDRAMPEPCAVWLELPQHSDAAEPRQERLQHAVPVRAHARAPCMNLLLQHPP